MLLFSLPAVFGGYLVISKEANLLAVLGKLLSLPLPAKQRGLLRRSVGFSVRPAAVSMW